MSDDVYFSELHARHLYDGLEEESCVGEMRLIPGPSGDIETLTSCPECYDGERPMVIICHPHPLYGGSMNNKVVHILARTFNKMGMLSVTFNFRGVGKSKGRYDQGVGETRDLLAVVEHFHARYRSAPIWIAGFSFGSYVALNGHKEAGAERLLLVAPPVGMFNYDDLPEVKIPWLVIQGGKDEITPPETVSQWVAQQHPRPTYRWLADADHFFHGRLNRLSDAIISLWGDEVGAEGA